MILRHQFGTMSEKRMERLVNTEWIRYVNDIMSLPDEFLRTYPTPSREAEEELTKGKTEFKDLIERLFFIEITY